MGGDGHGSGINPYVHPNSYPFAPAGGHESWAPQQATINEHVRYDERRDTFAGPSSFHTASIPPRAPPLQQEPDVGCCAEGPWSCLTGMLFGPTFRLRLSDCSDTAAGSDRMYNLGKKASLRPAGESGRWSLPAGYPVPDQTQPSPDRRRSRKLSDAGGYEAIEERVQTQLDALRGRHHVPEHLLLELPFQPPRSWEYLTDIVVGGGMVTQYVITMLAALTLTQARVEEAWDVNNSALMQLGRSILVFYPLVTLTMLLLANAEMVLRRFMWYRLLSLGIVVDWEDRPMWRSWFMAYFAISFLLVNVWTTYAAFMSTHRQPLDTITAWLIPNMQTLLLAKFYSTYIVYAETRIVTMCDFIENNPQLSRAIIDSCFMIEEAQVQAMVIRACRHMGSQGAPDPERPLFDVNQLRNEEPCGSSRTQPVLWSSVNELDSGAMGPPTLKYKQGGWCVWRWLVNTTVQELYATVFVAKLIYHRPFSRNIVAWPFSRDNRHFIMLGIASALCMLLVLAAEGYGLYLAQVQKQQTQVSLYGSDGCKDCYSDLYTSAADVQSCVKAGANMSTCSPQLVVPDSFNSTGSILDYLSGNGGSSSGEAALRGATVGMCLLQRLLTGVFNVSAEVIASMSQGGGQCPALLAHAGEVMKLAGGP